MKLKRRDFLKGASTGVVFGFAKYGEPVRETSSGQLQSGSGSLYLKGQLKSGVLTLEAQDFLDRADHCVIMRGTAEPTGSTHSTELYSAMFVHDRDLTVFALFHESGHSTRVVCSDSADARIGRVVVWNDAEAPQTFDIDKSKIMSASSVQEITDINGKIPDLEGKRNPPAFTWRELESVFGSDPALLEFMRGRKSTHQPPEKDKVSEWICRLLSWVPGSTLSLAWEAY
jgi:hypothetical protein